MRQVLQSASGIRKCDRLLLQSASGNTKCDSYYKVRRNNSMKIQIKNFVIGMMFQYLLKKLLSYALPLYPYKNI